MCEAGVKATKNPGDDVEERFARVRVTAGRFVEVYIDDHRVDLEHCDIRFAIGVLEDGRLLLGITRFADAAGFSMPWGPTVPEMAALMGALGARNAVLLDGGLSAHLVVRDGSGGTLERPGLRRVPLALEAVPR